VGHPKLVPNLNAELTPCDYGIRYQQNQQEREAQGDAKTLIRVLHG
jgi:hypothetical protein